MSENLARKLRELLMSMGLAPLWRWWQAEMLHILPPRLRALFCPMRAQLALGIEGGHRVLYLADDAGWHETFRWEPEGDSGPSLPPEVRGAMAERGNDTIVLVPPEMLLRRRLTVPQALGENLKEAVGFELDRYTPYKSDQAYFDVRVLERDEQRQTLVIELGTVPREPAKRLVDGLASQGFSVLGLVSDLPQPGNPSLEFLTGTTHAKAAGAWSQAQLLLLAAILLLALTALALPLWQKRQQVHALGPLVSEAKVRAEAAENLHRQFLAHQAEYNFALGRKHGNPTALEVVDEVSRILPDDTWAHMLELKSDPKNSAKNRELQIRGETGISGKLISVFEESRLFTQATYKSPVTKGQQGGGDVFHIGVEIRQRPIPQPEATAPGEPAAPPEGARGEQAPKPVERASVPESGQAKTGARVIE